MERKTLHPIFYTRCVPDGTGKTLHPISYTRYVHYRTKKYYTRFFTHVAFLTERKTSNLILHTLRSLQNEKILHPIFYTRCVPDGTGKTLHPISYTRYVHYRTKKYYTRFFTPVAFLAERKTLHPFSYTFIVPGRMALLFHQHFLRLTYSRSDVTIPSKSPASQYVVPNRRHRRQPCVIKQTI